MALEDVAFAQVDGDLTAAQLREFTITLPRRREAEYRDHFATDPLALRQLALITGPRVWVPDQAGEWSVVPSPWTDDHAKVIGEWPTPAER